MTKDKELQPTNHRGSTPTPAPSPRRGGANVPAPSPLPPYPTPPTLSQWINHTLSQKNTKINHRVRGNILHILLDAHPCHPMEATLQKLKTALNTPHHHTLPPELTSAVPSPIYQILLYGRKQGNKNPDWSVRVDIPPTPPAPRPATPLSLPQRGGQGGEGGETPISDKESILRHLSEILSPFGVSVKIQMSRIKTESPPSPSLGEGGRGVREEKTQKRLWIYCTCAYSPDPALLTEPLVQRLRHLHLDNVRDALILGIVAGVAKPEWWLRLDLTPPEQQLAAWARWGDMGALTKLLRQKLTTLGLDVSGVVEASTLHLFFSQSHPDAATSPIDKETVKARIQPLLDRIAPRGIVGATLYGQLAEASPPVWVDWLDLPAGRQVELAATVLECAAAGNLDAITYLVDRQLNPDLERKLLDGGIQVAIRRRNDILHILLDHPLTPPDRRLGSTLAMTIANLQISANAAGRRVSIASVCIYGRACGSLRPAWRHSTELSPPRDGDLLTRGLLDGGVGGMGERGRMGEIADHPDHTPHTPHTPHLLVPPAPLSPTASDLQSFLTKPRPFHRADDTNPTSADTTHWLRRLQNATHGFTSAKSASTPVTASASAFLVWGMLGLLATAQLDWFLASLVPQPNVPEIAVSRGEELFAPTLVREEVDGGGVFNSSSFTDTPKQTLPEIEFSYPTFNSQQLDEQLANYIRYVALSGKPDVLIVGSSRALRGIDPTAIAASLGTTRQSMKIFNFGINGATAQVVAWLLQELLAPDDLPELILWADGARAFNSGRADRTMEAIVASPGYKALQQGHKPTVPNPHTPSRTPTNKPKTPKSLNLASVYTELDTLLAAKLTTISASYAHRHHLLSLGIEKVRRSPHQLDNTSLPTLDAEDTENPQNPETATPDKTSESRPQPNGFLPISQKFDPYTYYDQYALVTGTYDADYQSFQLLGKQDEALQEILQFTKQRNINLVFINTPLTMGYLDPVRQTHEREFQQYILSLAMQWQFLFKDLSELWPTQNDYFSDPSHLNRFGAVEIARKLARDPLISWPTSPL